MEDNSRRCSRCEQWYSRDNFYVNDQSRDGLSCWCKGCHSKYRKKRYPAYKRRQLAIYGKLGVRAKRQVRQNNQRAYWNKVPSSLTWRQWLLKLVATSGICAYCDEYVGLFKLVMDHVVPLAQGGQNSIDNVMPCCRVCNSSKSNSTTWLERNGIILEESK